MTSNIGILLAAGRGTRLQPFTDTTPKPLVKYENKTLLEWNMDGMYDLVDYYIVVVHWLSQQIIDKIGQNYRGKKVIYAFQDNAKGGTLDAFRTALNVVDTNFNGLIVANSDDIRGNEYYTELNNTIQKSSNEPIIAAKIEKDETKLSQFGVIVLNKDGKYQKMVEKPKTFVSNLINIGLYYFPSKIVDLIPEKVSIEGHEEYLIDLFNLWVKTADVGVITPDQGFYKTVTKFEDLPEGN